ncbi:YceI family protein [Propionibacteriaceae bacterium Y1685]
MTDHTIETTELVPATWAIDPAHSEVAFTVRHLMSKVRGTFGDFSGEITTTDSDPANSKVNATIKLASVNTGNEMRDNHLRSDEIFAAEGNPEVTFVSTGITGADGDYVISGDLTLHGVTKPVDLKAEFLGVATDAYGAVRLGAEATTTLNRKDFGIDFNVPLDGGKLLLGDKIDLTLTIEAAKN